jgi:hypothetical protein
LSIFSQSARVVRPPAGASAVEFPKLPPYNEEGPNPDPEGTMTDSFTKKPIRVIDDEDSGPSIDVRLDQLDVVTTLLDDAGYRYTVDEDAMSINDEPYTTFVELEHSVDVAAIQKLLDDHEDPKLNRKRRSRSGHRG